MIPVQQLKLTNLGGGANEKVAGHLIADNQSARYDDSTYPLMNCHTNKSGSIVKRSGYSVYTGPVTIDASPDIVLTEIRGLYEYAKFSGVKYSVLVGSDGTNKRIIDFSTPASPVDITGSVSFTEDAKFDFCVVADALVITTDAQDMPMKWTGVGEVETLKETVDGSPDTYNYAPRGKYCEEFFNYGFIANTAANPERVYWSGLFDPESWTLTDFKRLSDGCTGMARRGDHLFLFTRNSITLCQYTGDSVNPFQFDVLDSGIGCVSNATIKNIEGVLFWLAGDGHIYRMAGFKPERLTEAIPRTLATLNVDGFEIACAEDHKELRQYWCAVTKDGSTVNDFVIAYDYFNNEIFLYQGMNILCLSNFADSQGSVKTYFGDNTGRIMLTNSGAADYPAGIKTAINFWKYTKLFDLGNPATTKRIRRLKVTANNDGNYTSQCAVLGDFGAAGGTSVTISHNAGGDLLGSTWIMGTSRLGRVSGLASRQDLAFNSKYIQMKFSNNAYDQPIEIRDAELMFQDYDQDRF
jgi:hypothetical protein